MDGNPPVHIIVVNVSLVANVKILRSVLMNNYLNGTYIPHDRRVYVLEEVDCSAWKDIVRSRIQNHGEPSQHDQQNEATGTLLSRRKNSNNNNNKKRGKHESHDDTDDEDESRSRTISSSDFPLTLGQILETLDGMIKRNGHVIFMTTNHIQEIDDALLRPGRIDYVLELGRLSKSDIREMYSQWFDGDEIPESVYRDMSDATFTQADVGCIFTHNREIVHRLLTKTAVSDEGKKTEKKYSVGPPSLCTAFVGLRSHSVAVGDPENDTD